MVLERLGVGGMRRISLNLALQGGGAHGAFTWGVLDRLLEEPTLDVGWISATSAGAVNAVALASGFARGGREGARAAMRGIWEGVPKAGVPDLLRFNPFLNGFAKAMGSVAVTMSPYDFNPLGFDPLRRLLEAHVDFARLRESAGPELLIGATEVATGRARVFRRSEITVEAVLASACLPTLHHAVEIEGRAYWDGGFTANPPIIPLIDGSPVGDTLIVLLSPLVVPGAPRTVREIAAHVNRITFNQPLLRDIEEVVDRRAHVKPSRGFFGRLLRPRPADAHRFHLIEAARYTALLAPDSKMKPEPEMLAHLFSGGRTEAQRWLDAHRGDIGRRETVDLERHFLTHPAPPRDPVALVTTPEPPRQRSSA